MKGTRKYYPPFEHTTDSFADRTGPPDECNAAIGSVIVNFFDLDAAIVAAVTRLFRTIHTDGSISCGPMPFNHKVEMFAAAFRELAMAKRFLGEYDCLDASEELVANCLDAVRRKEHVLLSPKSYRDSRHLLDIADFIATVAFDVEEFMLALDDFADA